MRVRFAGRYSLTVVVFLFLGLLLISPPCLRCLQAMTTAHRIALPYEYHTSTENAWISGIVSMLCGRELCFLLGPGEYIGRFFSWWVRARHPKPCFLPRCFLHAPTAQRLQIRSLVNKKNGKGDGRHNGYRTDMFAFGKTLVELFGFTLSVFNGPVVLEKPTDAGKRS